MYRARPYGIAILLDGRDADLGGSDGSLDVLEDPDPAVAVLDGREGGEATHGLRAEELVVLEDEDGALALGVDPANEGDVVGDGANDGAGGENVDGHVNSLFGVGYQLLADMNNLHPTVTVVQPGREKSSPGLPLYKSG